MHSLQSAKASSGCPTTPASITTARASRALAGETGDETFGHLKRSVELYPRFREQARVDDDFAAVRDDPRFEEALR